MTASHNIAVLRIDLGNDAFSGEDLGPELARVLRDLAGRLEEQSRAYLAGNGNRTMAKDLNGNTVGSLLIDAGAADDCPECGEPDGESNNLRGDELVYRCTACDHRWGPGED